MKTTGLTVIPSSTLNYGFGPILLQGHPFLQSETAEPKGQKYKAQKNQNRKT